MTKLKAAPAVVSAWMDEDEDNLIIACFVAFWVGFASVYAP